MGNKKGAQTTTTSNTTASPEAMAAYRDILARATTAADKPYEAYTGERVAGFSPDQLAAFQSTRDAQGMMSPYISEATGMARAGAAPIDAAAIARYQNPYQQSVIDATMADLQQQNAMAQSQVSGNAALRGALGGSRADVARALTAGEQARAQAPILANLRASGYDRAMAAAQQDRSAASSGASLITGIGDAAHTGAYRDIASLYGMGQQQQGNQQAGLDAAYQAWTQQQAYPTQQISWLTDIASRAGGGMGSSTTGTKTDPAPNPMNAILGLAGTVAGAALGGPMGASIGGSLGSSIGGSMGGGGANKSMLANGGVVPSYAMGGVVRGYADGGYVDNDPARPMLDLSLDDTGAYSMPGSDAGMTMAGTEGTPSGGFNWQSIGNPLMQAGAAMMASESPYLGVAAGTGLKAGLKAYGDNTKADADKKHKEAQLALQRDRLGASLKAQRERLAGENWQYLGQGADGAVILDKKSGTIETRPFSVTPRTGSAAGGVTEAQAFLRLKGHWAGRAEKEGLYGEEAAAFIAKNVAADMAEWRKMYGARTAPAGSPAAPGAVAPDVPYDPTAGLPAPAPTPMRDVTGMRSAPPADGPAFPGMVRSWDRAGGPGTPMPGEPAHAAPAARDARLPTVLPPAPPMTLRPAPPVRPAAIPPRPAGTPEKIKADLMDALRRHPGERAKIEGAAAAWGIRLD